MLLQWMFRLFVPSAMLVSYPLGLMAQTCLGLSPEENRIEIAFGVEHQNEGQRMGGWAHSNIAGRVGVLFGGSGGTIDRFAGSGSGLRGLVSVSRSKNPSNTCLFVEYEQARERFRNAFQVSSGSYTEHWTRAGWAVGGAFADLGGVRFSGHGAPELIWRVTHLEGRTLHLDPPPGFVIPMERRETAIHIGGRAMVSARHPKFYLLFSVKNRPRISSDLQWAVHLGFPI